MTKTKRMPARSLKKRPYKTPKLSIHGDLRIITRAKGGALGDGGPNPKTRVASGPG
jgi:hypothetical protein